MKDSSVAIVAIDDTEYMASKSILNMYYGTNNNIGTVAVEVNPAGQNIRPNVPARSHDYFHVFSKDVEKSQLILRSLSREEIALYKEQDAEGRFLWDNLRRRGGNSRPSDRPKQWFPIYMDGNNLRVPNMKWDDKTQAWIIEDKLRSNEIEVWPVDPKGENRIWRVNRDGAITGIAKDEICVIDKAGRKEISKKTRIPEGKKPKTLWYDSKYSATTHGTKLLQEMLGARLSFNYPKSLYLVKDCIFHWSSQEATILDFFAGSGTTGQAVIELNKEDKGSRKYILCEMGSYFNTVTIPRIKKSIYSPSWKNTEPKSRNNGVSQIVKYMQLEGYEDALSNVVLSEEKHQMAGLFGEDYLINYMLDVEAEGSLLNIDLFKTPFNYKMKINENNESKDKTVDLVETFNYLLGLAVVRQSVIAFFKAKHDDKGNYDGAVRLVTDIDGEYAFKQIEGTLPDGRRALVIWRTVTDDLIASNAALDAYFAKHRINPSDREFDIIYVNGDNNLENMKADDESWKVNVIEIEFKNRMFGEA